MTGEIEGNPRRRTRAEIEADIEYFRRECGFADKCDLHFENHDGACSHSEYGPAPSAKCRFGPLICGSLGIFTPATEKE